MTRPTAVPRQPTPQQHGKGKRTMFDKRLFQLAPGLGKLIAGKVALMWVGLLANIGFMLSLVMLLQGLLAAADPHTFSCNAASASPPICSAFRAPPSPRWPATSWFTWPWRSSACWFATWPPHTPHASAPKPPNGSSSLCVPSCTAKWWPSARPTGRASRPRMWSSPPAKASSRFKASSNCSCRSSSMRFLRRSPCSP